MKINNKDEEREEEKGWFKKFDGWNKLAVHYTWEDLFWKRKHKNIEWLENEIRL